MLRRSARLAVSSVPRASWDPKHHDARWVDSYAKPAVDRRTWPAKVFSIVPEPQTPTEFLHYSKRNLAYAYNAAIRACSTFPETIELYNEMKARGAEVDLDTAFAMLSRAARYERMTPEDVFLLSDELRALGARFDITVIEVLHTVWDHSAAASPQWREARRRELVDEYNRLANDDIARYGEQGHAALMVQQLSRYARDVAQLGGTLRYDVYQRMFAQITDWRMLAPQLVAMLQARAGPDAPTVSLNVGTATLEIPVVGELLRRKSDAEDAVQPWARSGLPPLPAGEPHGPQFYEDVQLNKAFLAAIERVADAGFFEHAATGLGDRGLAQQLFLVAWYSKAMITADVFAQLMDIVRFSADDGGRRGMAARGIFRRAFRAANMERTADLVQWCDTMKPLDARVVARYLMAVDPWENEGFDLGQVPGKEEGKMTLGFKKFGSAPKQAKEASQADALENAAKTDESAAEGASAVAPVPGTRKQGLTGRDVDERMASVRRTIQRFVGAGTKAKERKDGDENSAEAAILQAKKARMNAYMEPNGMQLVTAQLVFLRRLVASANVAGNVEVMQRVVFYLREVKVELDELCDAPAVAAASTAGASEETPLAEGPETEAWESLLAALRVVLDSTAARTASGKSTRDGKAAADKCFAEANELRTQVVNESKTRFGGKFRMLWLEEA